MNNGQVLKVFNEAIKNNDMTVRTIEAAHPYEGESVTEFIEYEINILRAAIGKMGFTIEVQPNDKEAIEAHIKSCEADIKQWEARLARVKGKEAEQDNPKYPKCKHCGAFAVHLLTSGELTLDGDCDDSQGNPSEFDTEVTVFAHVCMSCRETQDAGIEHPRRLDVARQEAKLLIKQLLTGTLPTELSHDWGITGTTQQDKGVACTKCHLLTNGHSFAFKVGNGLQFVANTIAPPCSGKPNLAWWDKVEQ